MSSPTPEAVTDQHETPVFYEALAEAGNTTPGIAADNLQEIMSVYGEHHVETFLELTATA